MMILPLAFTAALSFAPLAAKLPADQKPFECSRCAAWNERVEPYRLAENTWYVGTKGLSSVLVVDDEGLVLIDGGLPQSAAVILDNVRKAGFDPRRIRWILNSHAHFDHAGGIAALARLTGAAVAAGRDGVVALTRAPYHPDDPQAGFGVASRYPSVKHVRAIDNGDTITVGHTTITAVASPGHAPGGMSWRWKSCHDGTCRDVVYLDSLNPVSTDAYRFSDHPAVVAALRASADRLAALPCDVAMAAHPDQLPTPKDAATTPCAAYAQEGRENLRKRLGKEDAK
ncbi:subclass B3 metallo-beta-lactamase [Dokdonella fugitiva]|uniref:subclass B3 metallo-beta-lactamase n=1 Tax=Dokdonella fugitiva TaxID=328517 RepID=UPI0015FD058D|nr:subclass B3 metallo-beta-lactamase [Dokdonella fugitiva]MBA8882277.1 metallo-beta-lactamase class B [Dokdonella fugitiva]